MHPPIRRALCSSPARVGSRRNSLLIAVAILALPGCASRLSAQAFDDNVVRNRVEAYRASGISVAGGETVRARAALPDFYLARDFDPVWIDASGRWLARADTALLLLRDASSHGLEPGDYHVTSLDGLAARIREGRAGPLDRIDAEILLTDGLLLYGSHLLLGRVDPLRVEAEWIANRRQARLDERLLVALEGRRLRDYVTSLAPSQPEYARLRRGLATLRAAERDGGWGTIGDGPTFGVDSADARVPALRRRLRLSTDSLERRLAVEGGASPVFDASLERAVKSFQARHGLDADGVVGARTREAMDVPVVERIAQLIVNLERWRWLPDDLGGRHIRVNIAAYETEVWDGGSVAMRMRSIVGRQYRMTPSFNAQMRYLVLAPYWHVPPTIAAVDKLPLIQKDPGYVAASRMTLFDAATNSPVDATAVDWSAMSGSAFNRTYRLRQDPGPANALGNVKFMFPNRHNVYLHDTPQRELFARVARDFSSGCIRLEKPLELAEYLLSDQTEWNPARIRQVVADGRERSVNLSAPVAVYLLYFTAFVDDQDTLQIRPDIYGRDAAVRAALSGAPPDA
jgi:murein L,D-transpeptidase YcbB/YkuD